MGKLLTVEDVAEMLGVSRATVYNHIKNKNLPFIKIGRLTRFKAEAINEWVERQSEGEASDE